MKKPAVSGSLLIVLVLAFVAGRYTGTGVSKSQASSKQILYYVDPMHPAYRSPKPGVAPDCGMDLVPVYQDEDLAAKVHLPQGAVPISLEKQKIIGLRVEPVQINSGSRMIRTTGRVEPEDNRVYRLTAATDGWVQTLQNNPPGAVVNKDDLLATFYSLEFRNAQQAYLGSLASTEKVRSGGAQDDPNSIVHINEAQLHALGMGDPQIKELTKKRQTTRDITIASPVTGVVLARNISPSQWFDKGTEFYRIADLSKVWITADLYNDQQRAIHAGAKVKVNVRELQKTLLATVLAPPPLFDPASRTMKLRLEADNPGWSLRPDMFVDLELTAQVPAGLSIPADAVLDSGLQKVVYVQTAEDIFEPRAVETGTAFGDRVIVAHGLAKGDRVVSSGNFLLDSESRIRTRTFALPASPQR